MSNGHQAWRNNRMFVGEIDDAVDVAFKRRALNSVRSEEGLSLGSVVELADKEVRNSMVWEAGDSW